MHSPSCEADSAISLFDKVEPRPGEAKWPALGWSEWERGLQRIWDIAMAHYLQEGAEGSRAQGGDCQPHQSRKLPGAIGRGFHSLCFLGARSPTGPLGRDASGMGMERGRAGKAGQLCLGS